MNKDSISDANSGWWSSFWRRNVLRRGLLWDLVFVCTLACMSLTLAAYKQRERKREQELEREEESLK